MGMDDILMHPKHMHCKLWRSNCVVSNQPSSVLTLFSKSYVSIYVIARISLYSYTRVYFKGKYIYVYTAHGLVWLHVNIHQPSQVATVAIFTHAACLVLCLAIFIVVHCGWKDDVQILKNESKWPFVFLARKKSSAVLTQPATNAGWLFVTLTGCSAQWI
jgi:hypothetical protein